MEDVVIVGGCGESINLNVALSGFRGNAGSFRMGLAKGSSGNVPETVSLCWSDAGTVQRRCQDAATRVDERRRAEGAEQSGVCVFGTSCFLYL